MGKGCNNCALVCPLAPIVCGGSVFGPCFVIQYFILCPSCAIMRLV